MNRFAIALLLAAGAACTQFAGAQSDAQVPKSRREAASAWSEAGLEKIKVKGLDVVYARPGATLAGYRKVMLAPISVAFQRNWEKQPVPGSRIPISAKDSQRIREQLSALVREEFIKELSDGGYQLADAADEDVLDLNMSIIELRVAAPDIKTAGRVDTYAVSAGEMTLVADLRDSVTGDIVMRIFDRGEAHENFRAQRITRVENEAEARHLANGWAKAMRRELDLAKGIGVKH
ncbi:MAG TPA: DUF3313 family protein [Rudaea sp.]|nr:DUF3313 family protein [Rudaea sp.]